MAQGSLGLPVFTSEKVLSQVVLWVCKGLFRGLFGPSVNLGNTVQASCAHGIPKENMVNGYLC